MKTKKDTPMTRMLKRAARARREHGMALLFTLCILSMALITAMIFSSSSSTNRKVAAVYVDSSSARILADGIVNRAIMALLQSEEASYVCSYYGSNSPDNSSTAEYASDWIWKLEKKGLFEFNNGPLRFKTTTNNLSGTNNTTKYYDVTDSRCPSWEYVISKNYYGDSNEKTSHIYGRYAYVAIGQTDYLNPNGIGKTNYSDFNEEIFQKRLGRWTCEPDFIFNFTSTSNSGNYSDVVNPEKIRTKYAALSDNWTDPDVFVSDIIGKQLSDVDEDNPEDPDAHLKMMLEQYFEVSGQGDYNKFRSDGASISGLSNQTLATGEEYRFPLIRDDWNSIEVDTLRDNIPWFKNADSKKLGVVNQTVANLINYNATESRQSVSDADWISGVPSYTGNKRTPYINEVDAHISISGTLGFPMRDIYFETPGDPTSRKYIVWYTNCTYTHEITLTVETVNLYGDDALEVKTPVLIGEISYDYQKLNGDGDPTWLTQTIAFDAGNQPWDNPPTPQPGADRAYTTYTFTIDSGSFGNMTTPKRKESLSHRLYDSPVGHESDFYPYIKIKNVRLRLDRVILYDAAGNADLALMPEALSNGHQYLGESEEAVVAGGDSGVDYYFNTQVDDPRFNLGRDQWGDPAFTDADYSNATLGSYNAGKVTYKKNDPSNFDPFEEPEKTNISTAYIRHRPMETLWELGAIHRGAPWQTINLKCASAKGEALEEYKNGDGHLLDHVALTTPDLIKEPVLGLVNLNCVASLGSGSAPFAFKSLFTNFPIYKTYENLNKAGTTGQVDLIKGTSVDSDKDGDTDADTYAKDLSEAVTSAIMRGHLFRRTAVFPEKYADAQLGHIVKRNVPDAESEEIFCRVVNLLKWNKQPIRRATVLVLAQTIRDLGGARLTRTVPTENMDLWHDTGFQVYGNDEDKRTSPSSMNANSLKSMYNRTVELNQYDNLFDQITGESKVIVRLEWDGSANNNKGQWIITRKEYAE